MCYQFALFTNWLDRYGYEQEEVIDVYNKALNYGLTLFLETMPILDKIEAREQSGEVIYHDSSDNDKLGDRKGFTRDEC